MKRKHTDISGVICFTLHLEFGWLPFTMVMHQVSWREQLYNPAVLMLLAKVTCLLMRELYCDIIGLTSASITCLLNIRISSVFQKKIECLRILSPVFFVPPKIVTGLISPCQYSIQSNKSV